MSTDPIRTDVTYVYTAIGCQRCPLVMKWLRDRGVPFEVRDIRDHPEDRERFKALGFSSLPIVLPAEGSGLSAWAGLYMTGLEALRDYTAGALAH